MRKVLFIVNIDSFFISHRLPIAIQALENGYDVHLACSDSGFFDLLQQKGITVHRIHLSRSGMNVFSEIKSLISIYSIIKNVNPDIIHCITIKPVIYGSILSRFCFVKKRVFSISGLGYVFIENSLKVRLLRRIVSYLYRLGLNNSFSTVIFQNSDDMNMFIKLNIVKHKSSRLIKGSGVDLSLYQYKPINNASVTILFLARLLLDKGVIEFCEAAKILTEKYPNVEFVLVGDLDPDNPNSMSSFELAHYSTNGFVKHYGYRTDIPNVISASNIVVLPSYREGLPKSLIEAAACGRPVITTDVPGCRDAILPNVTGLLVPAQNISLLVSAIEELILFPHKAREMGLQGRIFAETTFSIDDVVASHFEIYEND